MESPTFENLIAWINTFSSRSKVAHVLEDLSDGVIFLEILNELEPGMFPLQLSRMSIGNSGHLNELNMEKALSYFRAFFYEEKENSIFARLNTIQPRDVCETKDLRLILFLMEILVVLSVRCSRKEFVIHEIIKLPPVIQREIMTIIQKHSTPEHTDEKTISFLSNASADFGDENMGQEATYQMETQKDGLIEEERQKFCLLQNEYSALQEKYDKLFVTINEKDRRIAQLERKVELYSRDLEDERIKNDNLISVNVDYERNIIELMEKVRNQEKYIDEGIQYKGKYEALEENVERMQSLERNLERYKKKAEDIDILRAQKKEIEEQYKSQARELKKLHEEFAVLEKQGLAYEELRLSHASVLAQYSDVSLELTASVSREKELREKIMHELNTEKMSHISRLQTIPNLSLDETQLHEREQGSTYEIIVAQLREENEDLKNENYRLKNEIEALRTTQSSAIHPQSEGQNISTRPQSKMPSESDIRREAEMVQQLEKLNSTLRMYESQIQFLQGILTGKDEEWQRLTRENEALKGQLEHYRTQLSRAKENSAELKQAIEKKESALCVEIERNEEMIHTLQVENVKLKEKQNMLLSWQQENHGTSRSKAPSNASTRESIQALSEKLQERTSLSKFYEMKLKEVKKETQAELQQMSVSFYELGYQLNLVKSQCRCQNQSIANPPPPTRMQSIQSIQPTSQPSLSHTQLNASQTSQPASQQSQLQSFLQTPSNSSRIPANQSQQRSLPSATASATPATRNMSGTTPRTFIPPPNSQTQMASMRPGSYDRR